MTSSEQVTDFSVANWKPVEGKPGFVKVDSMKTYGALITALNAHLKAKDLEAEDYGFSVTPGTYSEATIPAKYLWLIAFVVEGGSEGYYVHVGALIRKDREPPEYCDFGFCKTYTAESGYKLATEAQRFLTAAEWN